MSLESWLAARETKYEDKANEAYKRWEIGLGGNTSHEDLAGSKERTRRENDREELGDQKVAWRCN
jgi:hypothetical protein